MDVPSVTIHGKMKIYFNFDSVLLFLYVLGDVLLATYRKHFALKTALAERCNCLHKQRDANLICCIEEGVAIEALVWRSL